MSLLTFVPIYQTRIWGGANFQKLYGRTLPGTEPIGESWELVDRPEAQSVVSDGEWKGKTLQDLWAGVDRKKIFGTGSPEVSRFPILIKLLDAEDKLSLQVHPPAAKAKELNGEPKTEMWYFLHTTPDASIYVGLKKGVNQKQFEAAVGTPELANLFHVLKTSPGEAMFLPSGRVHAIGAGNVILEIQQNSDTTYRVYDWDRKDSKTGKPRDLHIKESLASINFRDFEPQFTQPHSERVVNCEYFVVRRAFLYPDEFRQWINDGVSFQYHFLAQGELKIGERTFKPGDAWFMSADHETYELKPGPEGAELLTVMWPE
jgi:mannose-6-phosphate isomerase